MSFWKTLFGGGDREKAEAAGGPEESYKGFVIRAVPMRSGNEYQLAGAIEKEIDGELKHYDFIRADKFASLEEAGRYALVKGRQLVDEQGDRLFG